MVKIKVDMVTPTWLLKLELEISHLCLRLMSEYIKLKRIGGRQRGVVSWYWLFEAFLFKNITTKYKTTH